MATRDNDAEMADESAERDEQFGGAIDLLKADHQKVRQLFAQYKAGGDPRQKQQIAEQVFIELETHAQLEEMVFYPAFAEAAEAEGQQQVQEARQEHHAVKERIAALRGHEVDEAFEAKFRALMAHVEHHVQEEESAMFPEAEALLAEQDADLVDEMEELKEELLAS